MGRSAYGARLISRQDSPGNSRSGRLPARVNASKGRDMSRSRVRWVLSVGAVVVAALLIIGATQKSTRIQATSKANHFMPVPDGDEGEGLGRLESYWDTRLTHPTGDFNPAWVREAAHDAAAIPKAVPAAGPDGSDTPAALT